MDKNESDLSRTNTKRESNANVSMDSKASNTPANSKKKQALAKEEIRVINPLDPALSDPQVELSNWHLALGNYHQGVVACTTPKLSDFDPECLQYNIDISLNGQQFSGYPIIFRFFDIQITSVLPTNGTMEGGNVMKIYGSGFYDSNSKKAKMVSKYGEHQLELQYEKSDKSLRLQIPPISWVVGGETPTVEQVNYLQTTDMPQIDITLNGIEWSHVTKYLYINPSYKAIKAELEFGKDLPEEEAKHKWAAEEPLPKFENAEGIIVMQNQRSTKRSKSK